VHPTDLAAVAREAFHVVRGALTGSSRRTVGVAAVIRDAEGRLLLAENAVPRSRWGLPGGRLERREEPRAGLAREVREETGLEVEVGDLLAVVARRTVLVLVFSCTPVGGVLRPAPVEIASLAWLPEPEAADRLAPAARRHLQAALAGDRGGYLWDA
jgi:ADP-ribose pyrophosphatase YjhB (NUDIX family)